MHRDVPHVPPHGAFAPIDTSASQRVQQLQARMETLRQTAQHRLDQAHARRMHIQDQIRRMQASRK